MMAPISRGNSRKVFIVVAGGNPAAEPHFEDTIQHKRSLEEVRQFLPSREIENLGRIYHASNFIVWGAIPGPMDESRWEKRNRELARYFWKENEAGSTWELMYFIVNEERTNVPIGKLNPV